MADAQTDTMPQSLVLIPPAIAIAVQVTCLGAVVFGCKGALKAIVMMDGRIEGMQMHPLWFCCRRFDTTHMLAGRNESYPGERSNPK
jgi:hypothetical protein